MKVNQVKNIHILSRDNGECYICAAVCGALVVEDGEIGAERWVVEEDRESCEAVPTFAGGVLAGFCVREKRQESSGGRSRVLIRRSRVEGGES